MFCFKQAQNGTRDMIRFSSFRLHFCLRNFDLPGIKGRPGPQRHACVMNIHR